MFTLIRFLFTRFFGRKVGRIVSGSVMLAFGLLFLLISLGLSSEGMDATRSWVYTAILLIAGTIALVVGIRDKGTNPSKQNNASMGQYGQQPYGQPQNPYQQGGAYGQQPYGQPQNPYQQGR